MSTIRDSLEELSLLFDEMSFSERKLKKKTKSFLHIFSKLTDTRHQSYIKYSLANLIGICFVVALMGQFTSFAQVERMVKLLPEIFIKLGLVEKDCYPSNDTFRRAFMYIDNTEFREKVVGSLRKFFAKVDEVAGPKGRRMISGDGQEVRGTGRNLSGGGKERNINILNLYEVSTSLTLTSVPVDGKTNEIPVFQHLLRVYDIRDTIVTADALHLQTETCRIIADRKGYYCIAAKDNQHELRDRIEKIFADEQREREYFREYDREYSIITLRQGEITPEWPGARRIVKTISHKRDSRHEGEPSVMYFLTSLKDSHEIAEAIDRRWRIENGLHRFKDMQLNQDRIRVREKNALRNMVTLNNIIYSIYRITATVIGKTPEDAKLIYSVKPQELIRKIYPLTQGNSFTMLVKKNMRGTKESKKA